MHEQTTAPERQGSSSCGWMLRLPRLHSIRSSPRQVAMTAGCHDSLLLSIQKMIGGGRPAGGWHCRTRETPSCTTMGSILSFAHRGDPAREFIKKNSDPKPQLGGAMHTKTAMAEEQRAIATQQRQNKHRRKKAGGVMWELGACFKYKLVNLL